MERRKGINKGTNKRNAKKLNEEKIANNEKQKVEGKKKKKNLNCSLCDCKTSVLSISVSIFSALSKTLSKKAR